MLLDVIAFAAEFADAGTEYAAMLAIDAGGQRKVFAHPFRKEKAFARAPDEILKPPHLVHVSARRYPPPADHIHLALVDNLDRRLCLIKQLVANDQVRLSLLPQIRHTVPAQDLVDHVFGFSIVVRH